MYGLIDCNNFFVSCQRVFRPDLEGKPVAVLSNNDGCIIARSNEVKALDIPMGIPLFKVKHIIDTNRVTLFSANFELYGDMSQRIISIIRQECPLVEVYSIDECFLDVSQLAIDDYRGWGERLRQRLWSEVGIPVSVGLAPTKTLAKVASTYAKQHGGVMVIDSDDIRQAMLAELPIEEVWGIGRRIAPKLRDRGVSTAGQLVMASDAWLEQQFNITGMRMVRELRGQACLPFGDSHDTRQSIMRSRSFGHKVRAYHELESAVATFAAQAAARLRAQDSICTGIATFLSTGKHATQQRKVSALTTLGEATADTGRLITAALQGLEGLYDGEFAYAKAGVILVGIHAQADWQLSLLQGDERRDDRSDLMRTMDQLNARYGTVIWHASERRHDNGWQSLHQLRSPRYTTAWTELPKLH
jgi:DNA polymerase V